MLGRIFLSLFVCAGLLLPGSARAQSDVAFPLVTGPKPAGRGATAKGVVAGLDKAGLTVVRGDILEEAAEELGVAVASAEVAMAAACEYLAVVRLSGRRGRYTAKGTLRRASDGSVVAEIKRKYKGKKKATATGRVIGARFARAIEADRRGRPSDDADVAEVLAPPGARAISPTVDDSDSSMGMRDRRSEDSLAAASPPPPSISNSARGGDRGATAVTERRERKSDTTRPERKAFRFALSGGSRTFSSYSITVGGQPTSHNYSLEPLLALGAHAVFTLPDLGLLAEGDFGFMPVQFQIAVVDDPNRPPLDPTDPGGQFIGAGGNLGWRFDVARFGEASGLAVTPLVGVDYETLLVTDQGEQTVVNSWSTFALGGGVRVALELNRNIAIDLEGEFGAILGFDESPVTTGENGQGFRVGTRARGRYWISDLLGIEIGVAYSLRSVDLEGSGNRSAFSDDPAIVDANVGSEAFDLLAGAVLAF